MIFINGFILGLGFSLPSHLLSPSWRTQDFTVGTSSWVLKGVSICHIIVNMYIYNITIIILQLANHQTKNMEILGDQLIIIIIIKDNTCEKN